MCFELLSEVIRNPGIRQDEQDLQETINQNLQENVNQGLRRTLITHGLNPVNHVNHVKTFGIREDEQDSQETVSKPFELKTLIRPPSKSCESC